MARKPTHAACRVNHRWRSHRHVFALRAVPQSMLIASALYNIVGCGIKRHTALLRRIDHAFIYVMIAVRSRH